MSLLLQDTHFRERVDAFQERHGMRHVYLAMHAAFPISLTPDLLYLIRDNFNRDNRGLFLDIPWEAVGDLLLSGLCQEVGFEVYCMDAGLRQHLVDRLKRMPRFGEQRIQDLADFTGQYYGPALNNLNPDKRAMAQAQLWAAQLQADPEESLKWLGQALKDAQAAKDENTQLRLHYLLDYFPGMEGEVAKLRQFAKGNALNVMGLPEQAAAAFEGLEVQRGVVKIGGVAFGVGEGSRRPSVISELEQKDFDEGEIVVGKDASEPDEGSVEEPVRVFISYAQWDFKIFDQLRKHFKILERSKKITLQHSGKPIQDDEWNALIQNDLEEADVIVLLVSPGYLESDFAREVELKCALERQEEGSAKLFPVLARKCDLRSSPLARSKFANHGMPLDRERNPDKALSQISKEFKALIDHIRKTKGKLTKAEPVISTMPSRPPLRLNPHIQDLLNNMLPIQGGKFQMGDNKGKYGDEKPAHTVILSDYHLCKYQVTQAQWRAVMGKDPKDLRFKGKDDHPVENVSWNDCQEFIEKLNTLTGLNFRLPTEAEWEYAARGGENKKDHVYLYAGSDDLDKVAWYYKNSDGRTHLVGEKDPNGLGLYDMSGNVLEWCSDWYKSEYYSEIAKGEAVNPKGPVSGTSRVLRGGSWSVTSDNCRVSVRNDSVPVLRNDFIGFRLARD